MVLDQGFFFPKRIVGTLCAGITKQLHILCASDPAVFLAVVPKEEQKKTSRASQQPMGLMRLRLVRMRSGEGGVIPEVVVWCGVVWWGGVMP